MNNYIRNVWMSYNIFTQTLYGILQTSSHWKSKFSVFFIFFIHTYVASVRQWTETGVLFFVSLMTITIFRPLAFRYPISIRKIKQTVMETYSFFSSFITDYISSVYHFGAKSENLTIKLPLLYFHMMVQFIKTWFTSTLLEYITSIYNFVEY